MIDKVKKYYHTLKYLRWIQIKYQLLYRLKKPKPKNFFLKIDFQNIRSNTSFKLQESLTSQPSYFGENQFQFLNSSHQFNSSIDWNCQLHGKLWTYNLNYFEYLAQAEITKYEGLELIHDFIRQSSEIEDGFESFPISLRVIFWIKFISKHHIHEKQIDDALFLQLQILSKYPEYHLMGNHLLENGFGLLFGAIYFEDANLLRQAEQILTTQLQEQILPDGAHFELSPMYHQLMLYRILDSINLLQNNFKKNIAPLLNLFKQKAELMLGWMEELTFENGDMPLLNDSAIDIAPTATKILDYAKRLQVKTKKIKLKESGYRKFVNKHYEMIIDVGNIGPDYIPGHAHSDTFNFILYHKQKPLLVDTGISTYEKNQQRNLERSTRAHNTVMIAGQEQSEVWGGFRVARRATVIYLKEEGNQVVAKHDGYKKINCEQERRFIFKEKTIEIKDRTIGDKKAKAFFHFHSNINIQMNGKKIEWPFGSIEFEHAEKIEIEKYQLAQGFNHSQTATKLVVSFSDYLVSKINLN